MYASRLHACLNVVNLPRKHGNAAANDMLQTFLVHILYSPGVVMHKHFVGNTRFLVHAFWFR